MKTGSRHRAREAALQILYQAEVGGVDPAEAAARHWTIEQDDRRRLAPESQAFAGRLAAGTMAHVADIDPLIVQHAQHWRIERMAVIDRLILRMAIFELVHATDTPPSAVIDEAIELARTFSEGEAIRFVNGVLDAVYKSLKPAVP
ncbi:MAG: transcription antitermination factor NusB [Acidobacteriota bacterium]